MNPNSTEINVETDRAAGDRSVFEHYKRLIALRHSSAVVALGDFELLEPEHPTLYAFTRSLGSETLLIVGNFSNDRMDAPLLDSSEARNAPVLLSNYAEAAAGATELRPWEVRVLQLH